MIKIRLWHYKLLPVLPDKFIVAEWRECIAIKRQWEKGTLKHRLVSYVKNYNKILFLAYVYRVITEMENRHIKYKKELYTELYDFCSNKKVTNFILDKNNYPEHNNRYLKQCYYNLEEKYDRSIITEKEWNLIKKVCNNT